MSSKRKNSNAIFKMWMFQPILVVLLTYLLCYHTDDTLKFIPKISWHDSSNEIGQLYPNIPNDPSILFKIGKLSISNTQDALDEMSKLLDFQI